MKKFLSVLALSLAVATVANAGSIGRSSSGGSHSSSSVSRSSSSHSTSSFSQPSKPAVAPAPATARPGGIGGNTASVGVRKSEVTNSVKNDIAYSNPNAGKAGSFGAPSTPTTSPQYAPAPHYSSPAPVVVSGGGSGFGSSFAGALGGTIVGNMLFGNHGNGGGTTVINNGAAGVPNNGAVAAGPSVSSGGDAQFNPGGVNVQPKKEYTVWSFIADVFGFVIVVALLLSVAWLFYKGFQLVRNYVNKERGVSNIPFNPTRRFWEIQKAFAAGDVAVLNSLLGPDIVDEMTNGLQPSTLTLHNVSHEVRLANNTEFSIWYKFEDDGAEVNQIWHYEKFGGGLWKLNGIENV